MLPAVAREPVEHGTGVRATLSAGGPDVCRFWGTSRSRTLFWEVFRRIVRPSKNNQSAFCPFRHRWTPLDPASAVMVRLAMNSPMGLFSLMVEKMSDPP